MRSAIKLSEQWDRASNRFQFFKKYISGRNFVFTQDRTQSEIVALALTAAAAKLAAQGKQWDEATVRTCYAQGGIVRPTDPRSATRNAKSQTTRGMDLTNAKIVTATEATIAAPKIAAKKPPMLYAAIEEFLADYRGRVGLTRAIKMASDMGAYRRYQKDLRLDQIDADLLRATIAHFTARPITRTGMPMAVATVQSLVKAVKSLFDWLDFTDKWIAPRRFDRLFKVKYAKLRTHLEIKKESLGVDVFTLDELTTIYSTATARQRLFVLLALNIGETSQGISNLLKADLITDGDTWIIDRMRTKTGVQGRFTLWPETKALIKSHMDRNKSQALFVTADGNPLVHANEKKTGRIDSIDKLWRGPWKDRREKAKCRKLGFKYIRKTGATMIERITGSERVAQLYLSHRGQSVARRHYLASDFEPLHAALAKMHEQLARMFAAALPKAEQGHQSKAGAA